MRQNHYSIDLFLFINIGFCSLHIAHFPFNKLKHLKHTILQQQLLIINELLNSSKHIEQISSFITKFIITSFIGVLILKSIISIPFFVLINIDGIIINNNISISIL